MLLNNYMVFDNSDINKSNIQISVQKNLINFSPILYLNYKYYVHNDYRFQPLEYIINNKFYSNEFGISNYLPANNITLFKYAQSSIYGYIEKNNFNLLTSVMVPALVLGLIGLWDDIKNISPLLRFIVQSAVGIFISWILISHNTVGNSTGSRNLDAIITVVWIVGICNSINFFDNVDGGAAGSIAIASVATLDRKSTV